MLDQRLVFNDAERVATVLTAAGFNVEVSAIVGKTARELAWTLGHSARKRKLVVELISATVDEAA